MAQLVDGRYELIEVIGSGGMASVWRARDTRLERHVALKRPHPMSPDDPRFDGLIREARVAASVSHPHLVSVHDAGTDAEGLYLVMELVEAPSLAQVGPSLNADRILETGMQISRALAAVHRAGVVHQDVKPGNILMADGGAKLTDFGIARSVRSAAIDQPTASGPVVATAAYAAPEILAGHAAVDRSDIFALGVVLYELLAGRPPFPSLDHSQRPPALPGSVGQLLDQCLRQSPTERPSATMVAAELNAALSERAAARPPVTTAPVTAAPALANTTTAMPQVPATGYQAATAGVPVAPPSPPNGYAPAARPIAHSPAEGGGHDPTATQIMGSRPPMVFDSGGATPPDWSGKPAQQGRPPANRPPGPPSKAWIGPAAFGVIALAAVVTVIALLSGVLNRSSDGEQQASVVEEPETSVTVPTTVTTVEEDTDEAPADEQGEGDAAEEDDGDDDDGGFGLGLGGLIDRLESVDEFVDEVTERANEIDATAKEVRDVMKKVQEATKKVEEGKPGEAAEKLEDAARKVGERLDGESRQQLLTLLDDVAEELDLPDLELAERFGDDSESD